MGTQSEQLERKAHQVRTRLTETLEELRAGMTPGQVVDQFAHYAREGPAAEFLRNFAREIRLAISRRHRHESCPERQ
jgi:hypothetical protein